MAFNGFSRRGTGFLKDLASSNNKEWFDQNRSLYEEHLLLPLKQLATDLGPLIRSIDREIDIAPSINRTISKIYRDIRFSPDKSPFRTNQWLTFRRPNKVWGNVPEFYFWFNPEEYQIGMGFYSATPATMRKFRENIDYQPQRFMSIADKYRHHGYRVEGEEYRKTISNDLPDKYQEWYKKRNLYLTSTEKIAEGFYSISIKDEIEESFKFHADLYLFLIESLFGKT